MFKHTLMIIEVDISTTLLTAVKAIKDLYTHDECGVGGYGHLVFDDDNFDCIASCLADVASDSFKDSYDDHDEVKRLSYNALKAFSLLNEIDQQIAIWIFRGHIKMHDL